LQCQTRLHHKHTDHSFTHQKPEESNQRKWHRPTSTVASTTKACGELLLIQNYTMSGHLQSDLNLLKSRMISSTGILERDRAATAQPVCKRRLCMQVKRNTDVGRVKQVRAMMGFHDLQSTRSLGLHII
jgi:hypothetical protein